ncbi:MAG: hypothetical protein AVDCRST_MAG68-1619, partial [uncultured Gemmatimonadetes bacterium]
EHHRTLLLPRSRHRPPLLRGADQRTRAEAGRPHVDQRRHRPGPRRLDPRGRVHHHARERLHRHHDAAAPREPGRLHPGADPRRRL